MKTKKDIQNPESDQQLEMGHIEFLISLMSPLDQEKICYIDRFVHKYLIPGVMDEDEIYIEPLKFKLLKYLLFTMIVNYERESRANSIDPTTDLP